jgi:hypothetical protein
MEVSKSRKNPVNLSLSLKDATLRRVRKNTSHKSNRFANTFIEVPFVTRLTSTNVVNHTDICKVTDHV